MESFWSNFKFWLCYVNPNNNTRSFTKGMVRLAFWFCLNGENDDNL